MSLTPSMELGINYDGHQPRWSSFQWTPDPLPSLPPGTLIMSQSTWGSSVDSSQLPQYIFVTPSGEAQPQQLAQSSFRDVDAWAGTRWQPPQPAALPTAQVPEPRAKPIDHFLGQASTVDCQRPADFVDDMHRDGQAHVPHFPGGVRRRPVRLDILDGRPATRRESTQRRRRHRSPIARPHCGFQKGARHFRPARHRLRKKSRRARNCRLARWLSQWVAAIRWAMPNRGCSAVARHVAPRRDERWETSIWKKGTVT
ncbi:hypothetical protein MTO96_039630 [Rhipicephalus appendiculatus]